MKDYRLKNKDLRLEYFEKYFLWSVIFYDCDPAMFLLNYMHKRMELNTEQRYWIAWLYGNTYHLPTAWVIANEFPDYENVDLGRLRDWNNTNYKRLRYQSDQKWQKGHLPQMFESYAQNVGRGLQHDFFRNICDSQCPHENFDKLYKYIIKNFHKFGRYSAWFYMQTLKETCGLNIEPKTLLLEDENTHAQRDGLCYAIARDEWAGDKATQKSGHCLLELNAAASEILDSMRARYPQLKFDMFLLETTLCAFKKTFRESKGRYLGYYLDRQYDDIKQVENDGWPGIDWQLLWDGRNEILDARTNRETGVRKEDMAFFLQTGQVKYYELMQ